MEGFLPPSQDQASSRGVGGGTRARSVGWAVCSGARSFFAIHEVNTSRWSRFLSGDWNLFDAWAVFVVALTLLVSFQAGFCMLLLARRLGGLGSSLSLDLFDRSRGEPLARFALRLARLVAAFGVFQVLITGAWSFGPGVVSATLNFTISAALLGLCTVPFVRSMHTFKQAELRRLHAALAGDAEALATSPLGPRLRDLNLAELLAYRREVMDASVWPLDAALWGRWIFYLVLPPLSWVAAALVEQVVQGALPG